MRKRKTPGRDGKKKSEILGGMVRRKAEFSEAWYEEKQTSGRHGKKKRKR